jgi:DtxR family Mn-dependent transcriptional regulator
MKLSESAQELLEELWIAVEEEKLAGIVLNGKMPDGAEELVRSGLARHAAGQLMLTADGRPEAAAAVRRHRLAERLLADVLITAQGQLDEQACRLEHGLMEGLDESICTLLGHPTFCPHGKPIPQGECCRQIRDSVSRLIAPLRELEGGEGGQIAYIQMSNPQHLQKLMAMGVLPGSPIKLLRRSPSFVFEAGFSQFAVDEEIAADIYVRLRST